MNKIQFEENIIQLLYKSQISDIENNLTGFKLIIDNKQIKNITITTMSLLILEQLYGNNFMHNKSILSKFKFDEIKQYLQNEKKKFEKIDENDFSDFNVCRYAYCGIGLLLLKDEKNAKEIANYLNNKKRTPDYSWGLSLSDNTPDIISTYVVTMLLNRLHTDIKRPDFIEF